MKNRKLTLAIKNRALVRLCFDLVISIRKGQQLSAVLSGPGC